MRVVRVVRYVVALYKASPFLYLHSLFYQGPGFCFRLYTESNFHHMADAYLPEILRTNLVASALQLKCLGQDIQELEFMDPPDGDTGKPYYHNFLITL